MECAYCHKQYSSIYTLKTHQKTTKSCLTIQAQLGLPIDKKTYDCDWCAKPFTTNKRLLIHIATCKNKQDQVEHSQIFLQKTIEQTTRKIAEDMEDKIEQLSSDMRNQKEEMEYELKQKEEQIKNLTRQLDQLHHQPVVVTNQTIHNHVTIFNYMTPERVTAIFEKHYTIDTLLGGQKALANFFVDHFVLGEGKMVYICVDRARKKICYTTDFQNYLTDTNCETAVKLLSPGMPIIKSLVEWSEYERKYNPILDDIHESFDEILAIRSDGSIFQTQLSRRLPSSLEDKERMDKNQSELHTIDYLRKDEEKNYEVRKKDIVQEGPTEEPEWCHIMGVGLGRLDGLRKLFKREGVYKIHHELENHVKTNPQVAFDYEEYIKRGTYKGKVIWE
jgi:hypothetical protein